MKLWCWGGISESPATFSNTHFFQLVIFAGYTFGYTKLNNGNKGISGFEPDTSGVREGILARETRKNTTFVFVSPRTWDTSRGGPKREDWVKEKRNLNEWKDVWYIDGSMLEEWLSDCPAVAARYAKDQADALKW